MDIIAEGASKITVEDALEQLSVVVTRYSCQREISSTAELARLANVSEETVRWLKKSGRLSGVQKPMRQEVDRVIEALHLNKEGEAFVKHVKFLLDTVFRPVHEFVAPPLTQRFFGRSRA
jgi:hypothetical protein